MQGEGKGERDGEVVQNAMLPKAFTPYYHMVNVLKIKASQFAQLTP